MFSLDLLSTKLYLALVYGPKELTLISVIGSSGRKTDKSMVFYNISRTPLKSVWNYLSLRRQRGYPTGGTAIRISSTLQWSKRNGVSNKEAKHQRIESLKIYVGLWSKKRSGH